MSRRRISKLSAVPLLLSGSFACESPPEPPPLLSGFDTTGAAVVEYDSLPADAERWTVAAEPSLSVGSVEGVGPAVFGRVVGTSRSADGRIVVTDAHALELRAFGPAGEHLWTAGRSGEGPGEFQTVSAPDIVGDSVVVVDLALGRAQIFDLEGNHGGTFSLPAPPREVGSVRIFQGALDDGSLAVTMPLIRPEPETGYRRMAFLLTLCGADGGSCDPVGRFPAAEYVVAENPDGSSTGRSVAMGRVTVYGVGAERMAVAPQDRFEVFLFGRDGALEWILRVDREPVPVDGGIRERFVEAGLATIEDPEERREVRSRREEASFPETLPVLGGIHLDGAGRIWVEEFRPSFEEEAAGWWIFDSAGSVEATARMPERFTPHHIGEDDVLGVYLDTLDVAHVQLREIVRP